MNVSTNETVSRFEDIQKLVQVTSNVVRTHRAGDMHSGRVVDRVQVPTSSGHRITHLVNVDPRVP
jgi:hypothetical protein